MNQFIIPIIVLKCNGFFLKSGASPVFSFLGAGKLPVDKKLVDYTEKFCSGFWFLPFFLVTFTK